MTDNIVMQALAAALVCLWTACALVLVTIVRDLASSRLWLSTAIAACGLGAWASIGVAGLVMLLR